MGLKVQTTQIKETQTVGATSTSRLPAGSVSNAGVSENTLKQELSCEHMYVCLGSFNIRRSSGS